MILKQDLVCRKSEALILSRSPNIKYSQYILLLLLIIILLLIVIVIIIVHHTEY